MAKKKMQKVSLIKDGYIRDKFKNVSCRPLRAPEVKISCQMELDVNSDGASELETAARKHVEKYIDDRVGIVVKQLPKMAKKVEDIALQYCQKWPQDKPLSELNKKLGVVLDMEIKAHSTMIVNAMKGIEAGLPSAVESARKEVGKRKKAIRNMKIRTGARIVVIGSVSLAVGVGALIATAGGVAVSIATAGAAPVVALAIVAAVGAVATSLLTTVVGIRTAVVAMKAAGGSADKALSEMQKSMQVASKHMELVEDSLGPDKDLKTEWKKVGKKLTPAFQALELKVSNYEAHVYKAMAAGSKADKQVKKVLAKTEELGAKIKKEEAKNKNVRNDAKVLVLKERKERLEVRAEMIREKNMKNMKVIAEYWKRAKRIRVIVGAYKKDTPPILKSAFVILATLKEISPGLNDVVKLVASATKAATDVNKGVVAIDKVAKAA